MKLAILICLMVICLLMAAMVVALGVCAVALQDAAAFLSTSSGRNVEVRKPVQMPWEGDESTFNVVKPRGRFPDQM